MVRFRDLTARGKAHSQQATAQEALQTNGGLMELADPRASAVAATFFDKPEPQGFVPSGVWAKEPLAIGWKGRPWVYLEGTTKLWLSV